MPDTFILLFVMNQIRQSGHLLFVFDQRLGRGTASDASIVQVRASAKHERLVMSKKHVRLVICWQGARSTMRPLRALLSLERKREKSGNEAGKGHISKRMER